MRKIVICDEDRKNATCIKKVVSGHTENNKKEILYYKDSSTLGKDLKKFDSQIDVLFTSVTFDKGADGIQLAQDVMNIYPRCQVIFMEELNKYNSDIYDVAHVFFLKKPLNEERIANAWKKVEQHMRNIEKNFFTFSTRAGTYSIPYEKILAFEKDKRKVVVLTSAGKDYSFYGKFDDFMEELDENFIRCHNSIIVNVSHVEKIEKGNMFLEYGDGHIIIPISRTYMKEMREVFNNMLTIQEMRV